MKYLKLSLVILAIVGIAYGVHAASIPFSEDASQGPGVWYVPVYNNSSSAVSAGDIVIWDIDASTGDNDNYINTTTTGDTYIVAGVIWPKAVGAKAEGTMAIKGVVDCNVNGAGVDEMGLICTSGTAGEGRTCQTDDAAIAIATADIVGTTGKCMVILR